MSQLVRSKVAVIGYTGFVGSTLMDHLPNADGYNSKNIDDIADKAYDFIICAGLPAMKWWINQHPDEDLANLNRLQKALARVECKDRFVLISTIDVHDVARPEGQDEVHVTPADHAYGKHRLMMEEWVKMQYVGKWSILRLAGLFGVGLKKNVIYDLLNDNMVDNVCVNHTFQWYNMRNMFSDIEKACAHQEACTRNLYSEPLGVDEMVQSAFPEFWDRLKDNVSPNPIVYAIKSSRTSSGWMCSKAQVLQQLRKFVGIYRKMRGGCGKLLSVSNLAWPFVQENHALRLLQKYGIGNLEIAPTRYGTWDELIDAEEIRDRVERFGLRVYSTQAVFFGLSINLFDDPNEFEAHMRRVIDLTARFGAKRIVLGSPKNRLLPEGVRVGVCDTYSGLRSAVEVLERIGKYAAENFPDVVVCLEPNSKKYGCNFVTNLAEACTVVQDVASLNIGINLDTGNAEMEGEDVVALIGGCAPEMKARVKHIQVSKPFLAALDSEPSGDWSAALRSLFTDHVISLEMKEICPTRLPTCIYNLYAFA